MRRIRALESSTTRLSPTPCEDPPTRAIDLATRTSSVLGDLELSPATRSWPPRIESRLKRLAAAATRLEDSL